MLKYLEKIHQNLNKDIKFLFKKIDEIEQGFQNLLIVKDEKLLKKDFYCIKINIFVNIEIIKNLFNSKSFLKVLIGKGILSYNKKVLLNLENDLKKVYCYKDFQKLIKKYYKKTEPWIYKKLAIIC